MEGRNDSDCVAARKLPEKRGNQGKLISRNDSDCVAARGCRLKLMANRTVNRGTWSVERIQARADIPAQIRQAQPIRKANPPMGVIAPSQRNPVKQRA